MASFVGLDQDAAELQQRIERFHVVRESIVKQVREVIVGQDEVLEQVLIALFVGGALPVDRDAGDGEDADGADDCRRTWAAVSADSVHAGPDAVGYHGDRHHRGRPEHRPSQVDVCEGAYLRQCRAGG